MISTWNPFSKKGNKEKEQAKEDKERATEMLDRARERGKSYNEIYMEQKILAEALRTEQRRNHFADMMFIGFNAPRKS